MLGKGVRIDHGIASVRGIDRSGRLGWRRVMAMTLGL